MQIPGCQLHTRPSTSLLTVKVLSIVNTLFPFGTPPVAEWFHLKKPSLARASKLPVFTNYLLVCSLNAPRHPNLSKLFEIPSNLVSKLAQTCDQRLTVVDVRSSG